MMVGPMAQTCWLSLSSSLHRASCLLWGLGSARLQ